MADVICRWRNATPKTVCELVKDLPHAQMTSEEFRLKMGDDFFHTPYQLACQLGLYYEGNGKYIPRFSHDITEEEAQAYLEYWIQCYYAPNPYTKSLKGLQTPVYLIEELVKCLEQKGSPTDLKGTLTEIFHDQMGNMDIITNALNNYSKVISVKDGKAYLTANYKDYMRTMPNRQDKEAFYKNFDNATKRIKMPKGFISMSFRPYITAIKSKPFLLLAGISGTGKSRIVREMARACWDEDSEEFKAQKPKNFEMIQVKPNWHDSSELIGYVSRINGERYVVGPFLRFLVKAIQNPKTPHFLCLDEMNLAPVEQYFAEYLSVIESRKVNADGVIVTDPIVDFEQTDAYKSLIDQLFTDDEERKAYLTEEKGKRLSLPANLIVIGTVNMDETTFSFSRKVLDRAMTIEMNEVDLNAGLTERYEHIGKLGYEELIGTAVEGVDVYSDNQEVCDKTLNYLKAVNVVLEGTPFKVAYRTRNEFLLYVVNNLPYNKDEEGNELTEEYVIARALDEVTNMKILSRIEGDDTKVTDGLLDNLKRVITEELTKISDEFAAEKSVSLKKLNEMKQRLVSGYTSFWS